jgi:hypothetical protein
MASKAGIIYASMGLNVPFVGVSWTVVTTIDKHVLESLH